MKKLLLVLAFLIPVCASAQYKPGMIMEDGVWRAPTPQMALDAIATNPNSGRESAVAVLRQTMETRSAATRLPTNWDVWYVRARSTNGFMPP